MTSNHCQKRSLSSAKLGGARIEGCVCYLIAYLEGRVEATWLNLLGHDLGHLY